MNTLICNLNFKCLFKNVDIKMCINITMRLNIYQFILFFNVCLLYYTNRYNKLVLFLNFIVL